VHVRSRSHISVDSSTIATHPRAAIRTVGGGSVGATAAAMRSAIADRVSS
jgi:hypothetical protein